MDLVQGTLPRASFPILGPKLVPLSSKYTAEALKKKGNMKSMAARGVSLSNAYPDCYKIATSFDISIDIVKFGAISRKRTRDDNFVLFDG